MRPAIVSRRMTSPLTVTPGWIVIATAAALLGAAASAALPAWTAARVDMVEALSLE